MHLTDITIAAAGVTLLRGDGALVPAVLDITCRTMTKISQNLGWAFAFNALGIPLAALGSCRRSWQAARWHCRR